ncbi:MAG: hypothetical protein ACPHNY_01655 [Akkermansiaceae bacterium]
MMISQLKSLRILLLFAVTCSLSSCNYRALSQENKDLKERKAELARDVDKLILSMDVDPDADPPSVKVTKAEADLIRLTRERQELTISLQALREKRATLEAEYAKRKKAYGSKP